MNKEKAEKETDPLVPKSHVDIEAQSSNERNLPSLIEDAIDIIKLGVPIFIARLSWVGVRLSCHIPTCFLTC